MTGTRGFVLINALIIVAALAGAATLLLTRAETGRLRLEVGQTSTQLGYYLDAFDALAITILNADRANGAADHPREDWARADYNVPLDRGQIAGQITDLQSLFNLNWLNDQSNAHASDTFDRLLQRKGLSPQIGSAVRDFMQRGAHRTARPMTPRPHRLIRWVVHCC
ncbi:hypothetical protein [Sulfitobacter aestuariivivens]|uniref:hypothetical protein n=1 Tax=Sulfitobacter aestuariivivens TaxID=2766981 RepID=UPI003613F588